MEFKDIRVKGSLVSAGWQQAAWDACVADYDPNRLSSHLHQKGPQDGRDDPFPGHAIIPDHWYVSEIENRMLQKARRAGLITYDRHARSWSFTRGTA